MNLELAERHVTHYRHSWRRKTECLYYIIWVGFLTRGNVWLSEFCLYLQLRSHSMTWKTPFCCLTPFSSSNVFILISTTYLVNYNGCNFNSRLNFIILWYTSNNISWGPRFEYRPPLVENYPTVLTDWVLCVPVFRVHVLSQVVFGSSPDVRSWEAF